MMKDINAYVDSIIIESIIQNDNLVKNANDGVAQSFLTSVKNYFDSKVNPNDSSKDKVISVLQLLVPGTITAIFAAMGFPKIGFLLSIAQQVFKIDVLSGIGSIVSSLMQKTSTGAQLTSDQVDSVVKENLESKKANLSPSEESNIESKLQNVKSQLKDARTIKLALIAYENGEIDKFAGLEIGLQDRILKVITSIISWLFKIALASAGAIVISDSIHSLLGSSKSMPSLHSLDIPKQQSTPLFVSKQTKFPLKSSYDKKEYDQMNSYWTENYANNISSITNMVLKFAKEVYDGLDGLESMIMSTPTFKETVEIIADNNLMSKGSNIIFVPRTFTNKKQIVDMFIDDVAKLK